MILIFLTSAIVTALYGAVAWLAVRRILTHLQGNPDATRMVVEHVLMPVIGREKPKDNDDEPTTQPTEEPEREKPKEVF